MRSPDNQFTHPPFSLTVVLLFIGIAFCSKALYGQQILSNSGGNADNATIQMSWTIGELAIKTLTSENLRVTQGFQQSNLTITALNDHELTGRTPLVYPNPTPDQLTLKISASEFDGLSYLLFDIQGNILEQKFINSSETLISFKQRSPSVYFIKTIRNAEEVQTFKIVKK